ncbi:MAG: imidazoleglycerol-phosphate dehydratase HisB [Clostridiaceae bacterium]|nr:imidazoleglycerol-phosphate dehydratase HisB [Clostridiaceae bacterium]
MLSRKRETLETKIELKLAEQTDTNERSEIDTGIGFFDHMLTLLAFHSNLFLSVKADGDLEVDFHHTVEDTGIVLGELIYELYQSKKSFGRYGFFYLPMDESLARVTLDLSGRPGFYFNCNFASEKVGEFDTELVKEFFNAVAMNAKMTLHIDLLKGGNSHHEIEAVFKAFGRSLAIALETKTGGVPSSKGVIA